MRLSLAHISRALVLLTVPLAAAAKTVIPEAAQPQLAVTADGRVWLAYGRLMSTPAAATEGHAHGTTPDGTGHKKGATPQPMRMGDVFVALSNDGGATFAAPVKVAHVPQLMLGMRRGPRIAAHGNRVTVTVVGEQLIAFHSTDAGQTWSGPVTINNVPTSAREGLHDLAAAPDGSLFVTWLDLRNGKTELWGASSNDGGRTWGANEQVYRSPDKSICECCHPSALFDAQGNLAVMWRNSIGGSRDLWMTTRPNGARAFAPAKKLGTGTWKLNACPMDGGRIVALGGRKFGSVWQRGGEVFLTSSDGAETLLGKGKQPLAITRGDETIVFWQQGDDLVSLRNPKNGRTEKYAANARFATAVTLPGNRGTVLAYEQGGAKDKQPGFVVERL
jgi:hypothetical protein